jgi:2-dehydro-3-deoxyphosphogalactonate aldolase
MSAPTSAKWLPNILPLIAILRGVRPNEVLDIAAALESAGIRAIEIPLNSPDPLTSIRALCDKFGTRCLCGAGTVLDVAQVDAVQAAGAKLIVTPNIDPAVIERAARHGLTVIPGFATATEAFRAIAAGANALKLFPAASYGARHLRALRDVLPREIPVFAVGGVGAATLVDWREAGAFGAAIGGELYQPGDTAAVVAERATALIAAWRAAST